MTHVYDKLITARRSQGGLFFLLLDPDKTDSRIWLGLAESAADCGVDALLVGGSMVACADFSESVRRIKAHTSLPVILLPGGALQIAPEFDAVLFTSLLSGRNPMYLIEEQVKGAPLIKKYELETIPTAYLLVESGRLTSAHYFSASLPIPRTKPDIACAHALAAQYLGMKLVYLEAGSGAEHPVPLDMIEAVAHEVTLPIAVGGGLHSPEQVAQRVAAGAAIVVMGNHFESGAGERHLRECAEAAHPLVSVAV